MYIHVRVKTGQRQESIVQISETKFEISVKEEAKQNKANIRVLELMRVYFKASNIKIVSGHHSPSKLLSIEK